MRAASVLGIEAGQLWGKLIPVQVFGIVLCLAHAVLAGVQEKKRGAGLHGKLAEAAGAVDAAEEAQHQKDENEYARPKLFVFNICLTIAVIAMLVWDKFPSYFPFMLGVAAALLVNYTPIKLQKKMINRHAGPALIDVYKRQPYAHLKDLWPGCLGHKVKSCLLYTSPLQDHRKTGKGPLQLCFPCLI